MQSRYAVRDAWHYDTDLQDADVAKLVSTYTDTLAAIELLKTETRHKASKGAGSDAQAAVKRVEESNAVLGEVLGRLADPKYFNYQHDATSDMSATKFVAVVEIAEAICGFLALPDVLSIRQVSKQLRAVVGGSPKLKARLRRVVNLECLDSDSAGLSVIFDENGKGEASLLLGHALEWWPCVECIRLRYCEPDYYNGLRGSSSYIRISCTTDEESTMSPPGLGFRKMLILSSSLAWMSVEEGKTIGACDVNRLEIVNTKGITVGDVENTLLPLREARQRCGCADVMALGVAGADCECVDTVNIVGGLPAEVRTLLQAKVDEERRSQGLALGEEVEHALTGSTAL